MLAHQVGRALAEKAFFGHGMGWEGVGWGRGWLSIGGAAEVVFGMRGWCCEWIWNLLRVVLLVAWGSVNSFAAGLGIYCM